MQYILYSQILVFCVCILFVILYHMYKNNDFRKSQSNFFYLLIFCSIFFLIDAFWGFIDIGIIKPPHFIQFLINALYFIFSGIVGYTWFICSEDELGYDTKNNSKYKTICLIPCIVLILMTLMSYWTEWIFFIDSSGYHRGNLYLVQVFICSGYIVVAAIRAIMKTYNKEDFLHFAQYRSFATLAMFTLLFGALQTFFPDIPYWSMGITLSLVSLFCDLQQKMISTDSLTHLNNKYRLLQYLKRCLSEYDGTEQLYLMFMELNEIKNINEIFGKTEGDSLLIEMSQMLKEIFANTNAFISRSDGAQFAIIYKTDESIDIELLFNAIQEKLNYVLNTKEYDITLTTSYAKYSKKMSSMQEFLAKAHTPST